MNNPETNGSATQQSAPTQSVNLPKVQLRGRNVTDDWVALFKQLQDKKVTVPMTDAKASSGDGLCQVYSAALGLPGCSDSLMVLAKSLNPGIGDVLSTGQPIKVPDLALHPSEWSVVLDRESSIDAPKLTDFETRWASSIKSKDSRGSRVKLVFKAYDVYLPNLDAANSIDENGTPQAPPLSATFDHGSSQNQAISKQLVITHEPLFLDKKFGVSPHQHLNECSKPGYTGHYAVPYSMLLDEVDLPDCAKKCQGKCPEIELLDTKVFMHPDIRDAVKEGGIDGGQQSGTLDAPCPTIPYSSESHGTMLASIMVSQNSQTSQFVGLASDAKLVSYDTSAVNSNDHWIDVIQSIADRAFDNPQIFVFAGQFKTIDHQGRYNDDNDRFVDPAVVDIILKQALIWITAAGQPDGESPVGHQLAKIIPESPMNLGDQKTVIVVTSCEKCVGPDVSLWRGANYSTPEEGLVNVAAPGGTDASMIPGAADGFHYSETLGTSMATAFVGGLAGAMLSCYPEYQNKPNFLKTRLQVTATPFPHYADAAKVTGGIVNIKRALLDPNSDWIDRGNGFEQMTETHWCKDTVSLLDGSSGDPMDAIKAKRIAAILRSSDASGKPQWRLANADLDTATNRWSKPGVWADDAPVLAGKIGDGAAAKDVKLSGAGIYSFIPNVRFKNLKVLACGK